MKLKNIVKYAVIMFPLVTLIKPAMAKADMPNPCSLSSCNKNTTTTSLAKNIALVEKSIQRLQYIIEKKELLKAEDQVWLSDLQLAIGRETMLVPDPDKPDTSKTLDSRLLVKRLNANIEERIILLETLRTVLEGTIYKPEIKQLGPIKIPVHNSELGTLLHSEYTEESFSKLFALAKAKGAFREEVDFSTGLVKTAALAEGENPEMLRQWVTDSVRCGDLQRYSHPQEYAHALLTLAKFYHQPTELRAFDEIIKDPAKYRNGGVMTGVAHIFNPKTLERDANWFNNKRLESHGLALKALSDNVIDTFIHNKSWGFNSAIFQQPENITNLTETISNLAAYLIAINYPDAPSAGPWEETPFAGGLTWDTEAIRSALASLKDLMFNPSYANNPNIKEIRKQLQKTKQQAIWNDPTLLGKSIEEGRQKIISRLVTSKEPIEHPIRPIDSSLVFVSGSTVILADNLLNDVYNHMLVLTYVENKLVRDNGILRYAPFTVTLKDGTKQESPDSYLSKNYWIGFDKENKLNLEWRKLLSQFGSKDTSDPVVFLARAQFATQNSEAEWFMVSDIAYGYAFQVSKILSIITQEQRKATAEEKQLIDFGMKKTTEFINRSFARITDNCSPKKPCIKSNGKTSKPVAIPEAYEYVSTIDPAVSQNVLPGADTPLAWARASLYRASNQFLANLKIKEQGL